jgi:TRP (transient receptor potential)-like protein
MLSECWNPILNTCQTKSSIMAALFNVVYTLDNNTLTYDISTDSSVTGTFTVQLEVIAYGYTAMNKSIDPCQNILSSNFCPIQQTGPLVLPSDLSSKIPSMARLIHRTCHQQGRCVVDIAFTVPDLVRIYIVSSSVACVEAELSNGQTVYQKAVGLTTATIVGLALTASGLWIWIRLAVTRVAWMTSCRETGSSLTESQLITNSYR